MPQIDFGQAFATPDERQVPKPEDWQPISANPVEGPGEEIKTATVRRSRLRRSDWVNIIFAIIAILGGLLCAFYFFDGAEILRTAVWPRELPDARPPGRGTLVPPRLVASPDAPLPKSSPAARDRSGDPFSRVPDLLSLSSPNSRFGRAAWGTGPISVVTFGNSSPSWLLSQLSLPAPGGDDLMQAFTRGITDLGRIANLDARRKAGAVQSGKRSAPE